MKDLIKANNPWSIFELSWNVILNIIKYFSNFIPIEYLRLSNAILTIEPEFINEDASYVITLK